jgi:hypothetical protein
LASPTPTPATQAAAVPAPLPRTFLVNLTVLLAIGVVGSGWILRYTDWFPAVGGVLALGGLFSWLAFVSKLLSEEVTGQLQQRFLAAFSKGYVCAILLVLIAALAFTASFFGAIRIEVQSTAQIRGFDLYREGSGEVEHLVITSDGSSNIPVLTVFGASQWRIKIPGFPYQSVTVRPFQRPTLYFPQSFKRPVLLIVPSNELVHDRSDYTLKLTIAVGNRRVVIDDYSWFVFWVGCGPDVQLPLVEQATLRAEKARLRPMLDAKEYPLLLDPSVDTPFSLPAWLGSNATEKDLEFPLDSPTITITAKDISEGSSAGGQPGNVIEKTLPLKPSVGSFVQVVHLEKSFWKAAH